MTKLPERFPAGPFKDWLRVYSEECSRDLEFELGVPDRTMRDIKAGSKKTVAFDVVDTALQRARRIIELDDVPIFWVDDLYPEFFAGERAA